MGTGSEMLYKTAVVVSVTLGRLDSSGIACKAGEASSGGAPL